MADPYFGPAFVDVDEWRDTPVRHRYLHGGFEGTDTLFSVYLPVVEQYEGRFLQLIQGGVGGDDATLTGPANLGGTNLQFAFSCGAYMVESNQGHIGLDLSVEPSVMVWRASAETARFAKSLAQEMYGSEPRHGYCFGGSGGGLRSIACLEQGSDVWDGAVPFIIGSPNGGGLLTTMSSTANALRVLGPKLDTIVDAMAPGGSGDPFAGLTSDERIVLATLYRAGYPRGAEPQLAFHGQALMIWAWDAPNLVRCDPTYFEDFWTVPGFAGADGLLASAVIVEKTTVADIFTPAELAGLDGPSTGSGKLGAAFFGGGPDAPAAVGVVGVDASRLIGASIRFTSGEASGRQVYCTGSVGDALLSSVVSGPIFDGVRPGDEVIIDNREFLAFCHYDRHHVQPGNLSTVQFTVDGAPIYPQRAPFPMTELRAMTRADDHTGSFSGKMIIVHNTVDDYAWPHAAVMYERLVCRQLGEAADQQLRVWFNDDAAHIPGSVFGAAATSRLVDYFGSVEEALLQLIEWVERGVEPSPATRYDWDDQSGRLVLPTLAAERAGVQPVVSLSVDPICAGVGESVTLEAVAETPPGAGRVVALEWDPEGAGTRPLRDPTVDGTESAVRAALVHRFDRPGTYFPSVRATARRGGDVDSAHARIPNLARVRVVVA